MLSTPPAKMNRREPVIGPYNQEHLTLTLFRDGKEVQHNIHRTPIFIPLDNVTTPVDGLHYFIEAVPVTLKELGEEAITRIWVTFKEVQNIKKMLVDIDLEMCIQDLQENGPKVESLHDSTDVMVTLLRDGMEVTYRFYRDAIRDANPFIYNGYFFKTANTISSSCIWISSSEVIQIQKALHDIDEKLYDMHMAEDADKEYSEDYDVDAEWESNNWDSRY